MRVDLPYFQNVYPLRNEWSIKIIMNMKRIGLILIVVGMISLIIGIILLINGATVWIVIISIIINIIGINLMIHKRM